MVLIKLYKQIHYARTLNMHSCCTSKYTQICWSSLVLCVTDGTRVLNGHNSTCAYFNVRNGHSSRWTVLYIFFFSF